MADERRFQLEEYIEIVLYRKWLVLIPMLVMGLLTGIGSQFLPNIYRGQTLILVEGQKVPEDFVKSPVSIELGDRINTIREQLLSRTRLEQIIREHGLFPDLVATMPMEDVVDVLRKNIDLEVQGRDSFRVYFTGRDPYIVQRVTDALASSFIEENLVDREKQATGTLDFLDSELDRVKRKLEEQEHHVRTFKQEHLGELPEQQEANQRNLDRLQNQLETVSRNLADAQNRRMLLQSALNEMSKSAVAGESSADLVSIDTQIERLEAQLADLKLRFTDAHPDVKRTKAEIAELRRKRATESRSGQGGAYEVNSRNRELIQQLRQAELDIEAARAERARTLAEMASYQRRVESSPKIEAELQILTRDYEKTKEEYDDLLKKRQAAELAANLEIEQKGTQFKVVDPAQLPQRPYKPNRPRIVLLGLLLGLGIGLGAVFLAEHFDNSFRNAQDVENVCQVAVLATVPTFILRAPGQTRRLIKLVGLIALAVLASALILLLILQLGFGVNLLGLLRG